MIDFLNIKKKSNITQLSSEQTGEQRAFVGFMDTSFGTQVPPPSGFSFFQNNNNPSFLPASKNVPNFNGFSNKIQLSRPDRKMEMNVPLPAHAKISKGSKRSERPGRKPRPSSKVVGPLVPNPEILGFSHIEHKRRETPRFLIGQHPQLEQRTFVQDSWDKANQQKMEQLEESIEDITELYETLRKMRDMERKVMENKGLVDKADSAKDLTEAISFQGTCQDMCPVFERSRRNVEHTVFSYEKNTAADKKASRFKALKVFARPAAAAAPPLPSDVRPPHILTQTLDYIIDNLLHTLPESEGFLWDRMRSIRQDFTYQNYSGPEAIDCNERIVRIHLLIIHIMGRSKGEFSLQQELEQLHKSLITLSEIYDEVRDAGGECPNEAEFRAYALLSKIRDPAYDKKIQELPQKIFQDEKVQIALCFRRIISNTNFSERGYMRTENCLNFYNRFFQLIKSNKLPFLISSFLELYVNEVRFYAFKALSHSINKRYKPMPYEYLIEEFLFNDRRELEDFCEYYSIAMTDEGVELKSLSHHSHKLIEKKPMKHAYLKCIDDKLKSTSYSALVNSGKANCKETEGPVTKTPTAKFSGQPKTSQEAILKIPAVIAQSVPGPSESLGPVNVKGPTKFNGPADFNGPPFSVNRQQTAQPMFSITQPERPIFSDKSKSPTNVENRASAGQAQNHLNPTDGKTIETNNAKKLEADQKEFELAAERRNTRIEASRSIANQLIEKVVKEQVSKAIQQSLQKDQKRKLEVKELAQDLYHAFIHERLYQTYLESKADVFYKKKREKQIWLKWKTAYERSCKKREMELKRKSEIKNVARLLGAPHCKKTKILETPKYDNASAFTLHLSSRKDTTFSPVADEVNKFSIQNEARKEIWESIKLKDLFFNELDRQCGKSEGISRADVFIYGNNWGSIPNKWIMSKFDVRSKNSPKTLKGKSLEMEISCIDSHYDPAKFAYAKLLVFNTGVTDSNIFDLEMKLQHDGEELIKLVTGISLNTNICFNLLILYWESAETPLNELVIQKYLKLNRITRSFNSVLQSVCVININGNAPHRELQKALEQTSQQYQLRLTDRGKYNASLLKCRSLAGIAGEKGLPDATKDIDTKMKRLLEQEKSKHEKELDTRNTYAHLKHHIAASPKGNKRKLPVLLSRAKENNFKTPLANRSLSSSSPAVTSHLAAKFRRDLHPARLQRSTTPATPTHCTNIPEFSASASTSLLANASDTSFEQPLITREPALFRTPINSTTTNATSSVETSARPQDMPESLVQLKALIESVKKKVNSG